MTTAVALNLDNDDKAAARSEPSWLQAHREKALAHFTTHGLPTTRQEDWKYTNLRLLGRQRFITGASGTATTSAVAPIGIDDLPAIVMVNGRVQQSVPGTGVNIGLLSDQWDTGKQLGRQVDFERHPMAALNTAYFDDVVVIDTPAGGKSTAPVLIEHISAPASEPAMLSPRVLVQVGANSHVTIIERFVSIGDAPNFINSVAEITLGRGASCHHYRLQELNPEAFATSLVTVEQSADSTYSSHVTDLGGRLIRNDLHVRLQEAGAHAQLMGLYLAVGRQHIDNHTRIDHQAAHTTSDEIYRGVLAGRARAVFNGKVVVAQDAQKVNANQSNRNLLLSGTAEIDTKPELEIYADDVRCSHGATVGQIDEDALFYLRSRGIGERTARALLTFAFADEVLAAIELPELRHYIEQLVAQRLPDRERLQDFV